MSNHHPPRMAIDAALGGSSLSFAYALFKDFIVYMKHRRRHVKDLREDLTDLENEAKILRARWLDNEEDINRRLASIQKSRQHEAWKGVVTGYLDDYNKMIEKHRKMIGAVQVHANGETRNQRHKEAEDSNGADVNGTSTNAPIHELADNSHLGADQVHANGETENQRHKKAEDSNGVDVNGSSTNAPIHELADNSHLGEHKIWTKQFFKLARLDKDVIKLKAKFSSARKDIPLADLTCAKKPKAVIRMVDAKELDVVPSHKKKLDELLAELQPCEVEAEAKLKRIAICGEPQVGKTNIMKNLNNWFDSCHPSQKLDYVIWVTVPTHMHKKEDVIKTIQESILRRLKLTDQISTIDDNKDIISGALREKSYMLIFDGFSSLIQLEDIGVFEEYKQRIVVIETKDPDLFRNFRFDSKIKVEKLPSEDGRKLFDSIMEGESLSEKCSAQIELILKELGGLPGAITYIAGKLKSNKTEEFWGGIKTRLTENVDGPTNLGLGGIFNAYGIAYKDLEQDHYKRCLLYAALFPKEFTIPITVLVECWQAENFLGCPDSTFFTARTYGSCVLDELTQHFLLEKFLEEYVKMPILLRRFAIGKTNGMSFVRSGLQTRCLNYEELEEARRAREKATRVSLTESKLEELCERPGCEGISTLFLQLNPRLITISDSSLKSMQKLRVLDLQSTGIKSLPPSISYLRALRSLYLNNCGDLTDLPSEMMKLKKLEVLDIRETSIYCLPEVVISLVGLRCLRFSFVPGACSPNPKPKGWLDIRRLSSAPTRTWLIFSPGTANQLNKLEELTIVLVISHGSSDSIVDRIEAEMLEFKNKNNEFKLILRGPSRSVDRPNPSVPATHVHDPTTGNPLPRSENESHSGGRTTGANSQPSRKDKGKGLAISNSQPSRKEKGKGLANCMPKITFKPKNKLTGVTIGGCSETDASRVDAHEDTDDSDDDQAERASRDFLAGEGTSGTGGGAEL